MNAELQRLRRRAREFEQQKQFDRALALYIQFLEGAGREIEDTDIGLYNVVGDLLQRQGSMGEALVYYEQAVDLWAERGFHNNAIALCNKILRQSPARTSVYYKLGRISALKGFRSDAKQNFLEYADRMQKAGQVDEAFRALQEFADLCPDQDDVRVMLAEWLRRENRPAEAVHQLELLHGKLAAEGKLEQARATRTRLEAIAPAAEVASGGGGAGLIFLDLDAEDASPPARGDDARPPVAAGTPGGLVFAFDPDAPDESPASVAPIADGSVDDDPVVEVPEVAATPEGPAEPSAATGIDEAALQLFDAWELTPAAGVAVALPVPTLDGEPVEGPPIEVSEPEDLAPAFELLVELPPVLDARPPEPAPDDSATDDTLDLDLTAIMATPVGTPIFGLDRVADEAPLPDLLDLRALGAPEGVPSEPIRSPSRPDLPTVLSEVPLELADVFGTAAEPAGQAVARGGGAEGGLAPSEEPTARDDVPVERVDAGAASDGTADASPPSVERPAETPARPDRHTTELVALVPNARPTEEVLTIPAEPVDGPGGDEPAGEGAPDVWVEPSTPGVREATKPYLRSVEEPSDFGMLRDQASDLAHQPPPTERPDDAGDYLALFGIETEAGTSGRLPTPAFSPASAEFADAEVRPVDSALPEGWPDDSDVPREAWPEDADRPAADGSAADAPPQVLIDGEWREDRVGDLVSGDHPRVPAEGARPPGASAPGTPRGVISFGGAEAQLRLRLELEPANPVLRRSLGELLLDQGRRDAGLQELDLAMSAFEQAGDLNGANAVAEVVLRVQPSSVRHHQKRVEFAVQAHDPSRLATAYVDLADALFRLGEVAKAHAVYSRVLDLQPAHPRALAALGLIAPDARGHFRSPTPPSAPAVRSTPPSARAAVEPDAAPPAPPAPSPAGDAAVAGHALPTPDGRGDTPPDGASVPATPDAARTSAAVPTGPALAEDPTPSEGDAPATSRVTPSRVAGIPEPIADESPVDLGAWLRATEDPRSTRMVTDAPPPSGDEAADFDEMLRRFKQGVAENLDEEDFAAHYDLGVAYKEMGLVDEAIREFQVALRSETHRIASYEALGQCFVENGQMQVALTLLRRALDTVAADDVRLVGVLYLAGVASEAMARREDARGYYERVFAVDVDFRDVARRLTALDTRTP